MTVETQHPLAADYLKRLRRAARRLPPGRRKELVSEIEAHLAEALDPRATDPEALDVLDRLGTPEAIVDAEQPGVARRAKPSGRTEKLAIILLVFGGFLAGVGWLVGVVLLWTSRIWTARDKWIGTLLVPGGLALPFFLVGAAVRGDTTRTSTDTAWIVIVAVLVLASIGSAMYLSRRARSG